jgi:hypothetical protein
MAIMIAIINGSVTIRAIIANRMSNDRRPA